MSTPAPAPTQPEKIKHEEIEEGEILTDEEDDDLMDLDEDEMDMGSLMTSLLATEEGDTVCTALVTIAQQLEMQNRILVKMLTQLQKK